MSISYDSLYLCHTCVVNFPLVEHRPRKLRFATNDIEHGWNQVLQVPECDPGFGTSELGFGLKFGAGPEIGIYFLVF